VFDTVGRDSEMSAALFRNCVPIFVSVRLASRKTPPSIYISIQIPYPPSTQNPPAANTPAGLPCAPFPLETTPRKAAPLCAFLFKTTQNPNNQESNPPR
jgi:hypothetical protein